MSRHHEKVVASRGGDVQRKSGRAVFDEHGGTSWEWQTSTGVFQRHITDDQLTALEARELQLVAESQAPKRQEDLWTYNSARTTRAANAAGASVQQSTFWRRLLG